jgi:hypothetical protein
MERARQQQTVTIDRGLFLVRYAAAEDAARPPLVRVSPDPAPNKDIGFLLHPDHSEPVLWQPDTCLLVRALAPGKLAVEVAAAQDGGSTAATVRIEPLTQGQPAAPLAQTKGAQKSSPADLKGLRILGHVTGLGDQLVNANEWLAGPSAPSRIEGIAIDWPDKPGDLEIRYAVKTAKPQPVSGCAMGLGSFAGTRGKAMPIVGVMLEMSGATAANLQFAVEAVFLGAPVRRIIGKRVVASGPTGREPLVGLRLGLENVLAAERPQAKSSASKPGGSAGRVRVFRNRPKPKQSVMA